MTQFLIDVGSSFYSNARIFLKFGDDIFSIHINSEVIRLPVLVAALFSSKISKLLNQDNTLRKFTINMDFVKNSSLSKIISVLTSQQQVSIINFENEEEILDVANFGVLFGNDSFIEPLETLLKKYENAEINEKNVFKMIKMKNIFAQIDCNEYCIDKELHFISKNLSYFSSSEKFIEWCKRKENEEYVERIISNKSVHLNKEDDLLSLIVNISKEDNRFVDLLSYVHLEYCTLESCKKLIAMIKENDVLQSKHYRDSILECISNRLLYNSGNEVDENYVKRRYSKSTAEEIKKNNKLHRGNVQEKQGSFEYYDILSKQIDDYLDNIFKLNQEINSLKSEHKIEIDKLKAKYEHEIDELKAEQEIKIHILDVEHEIEINELKGKRENVLQLNRK